MIMVMVMIMRHECEWGDLGGQHDRGVGKERIQRGEVNGSMLHVYVWIQYNETHQKLCKMWGKVRGNENLIEDMDLFKLHHTPVWNYHNEMLSYY